MAVINTNTKALFSQNALKISGQLQAKSMEQLSSGKRINTAGDDAAGLAISTRMTQQIRALNQAVRNAGDAISLIQTAEGATAEITNMMQRMRELAIQAINDTNSDPDRSYLDLEFQQLKQEVQRIAEMTEWNGFKVLDGTAGERVGEVPVYKATSVNLDGEVLINPTTLRTVAGSDGGEVQTLSIVTTTFLEGQEASISVLGETFYVAASGDDPLAVSTEEFLDEVVATLSESTLFGPGSNRSVEVARDENGNLLTDNDARPYLIFTFDVSDGVVSPVEFDKGTLDLADPDNEVVVNADIEADDPDAGHDSPVRAAVTSAVERFTGDAGFIKSGSLSLSIPSADSDSTSVTAVFLTEDNESIVMTGVADRAAGTVTFLRDTGNNRQVFSGELGPEGDTLVYTLRDTDSDTINVTDRAVSLEVSVQGSIPALRAGDLQINGLEVGASYASDDLLSPRNNASGSAIAKAAAINRVAAATGITVGESQSITFAGVPKPGVIKVAGVDISITAQEDTAVKAATKIAQALRASHLFDVGTGRVVSYASGGSVINIDYPVSEGNVGTIEVLPGTTGLVGIVDITQEFTTAAPGTGVYAKVNENVVTGQAMNADSVVSGVVWINGFASANITTSLNNTRESRQTVVEAINAVSGRTGVKAIDTGFDSKGITLVAQDGRNIEISFETDANHTVFGQRIGLREGVQASTLSLESKINAPVVLTSSTLGDISRVGFIEGNFTKNQAVYNTAPREVVDPPGAQVVNVVIEGDPAGGDTYSVTLNGITVTVGEEDANRDILDADGNEFPMDSVEGIRNALIRAINSNAQLSGVVNATKGNSPGELVVTAEVAGIPFTQSVSQTLDGGDPDTTSISSRVSVPNRVASYGALGNDDLVINGIEIRPSVAADDTKSITTVASSDPASSALAIAAAINSHQHETGVRALANGASAKGLVTETALPAGSGDMYTLYVNGVAIDVEFVQNEEGYERRAKVVQAINARVGQHGVTALDNGEGVSLNTDGRNLSVWYDSSIQDLSPSSFGLGVSDAQAQVTRISVKTADAITADHVITINGVEILAGGQGSGAGTAEELATAINTAITDDLSNEIRLLANIEVRYTSGDEFLEIVSTVPGAPFTVTGVGSGFDASVSPTDSYPDPGVEMVIRTVTANDMGSSVLSSIPFGDENSTSAKTAYGTVRLISDAALLPPLPSPVGAPPSDREAMLKASTKPFTVTVGDKGFGPQGNFVALGFQQGRFGGRSSEAMDPPKVGRLAFQVGASAQQLITIDLEDFGKNGSITNEITGDVDLNVNDRASRINSRAGAEKVLELLDVAMDKVNATRAQMGAVMNRLQYAMDNLSNVSMNQQASRSQIMDADYAKSSTELAKAQIMQQAATAVLAQANMSNQTVLQLLQG
jgi:flagellin